MDASALPGRRQRAREPGQARAGDGALTHIVQEIEGVLRSIDRGAAHAYAGSVEQ